MRKPPVIAQGSRHISVGALRDSLHLARGLIAQLQLIVDAGMHLTPDQLKAYAIAHAAIEGSYKAMVRVSREIRSLNTSAEEEVNTEALLKLVREQK